MTASGLPPDPPRPRGVLRDLLAPAITLALYLILLVVFDGETERGGLLTPTGSLDVHVAILGVVVIALRIVVLFVLPPAIVYQLTSRLLRRLSP